MVVMNGCMNARRGDNTHPFLQAPQQELCSGRRTLILGTPAFMVFPNDRQYSPLKNPIKAHDPIKLPIFLVEKISDLRRVLRVYIPECAWMVRNDMWGCSDD